MKQAMRGRILCGALALALVGAPTAAWSESSQPSGQEDVGLQNEAGVGALAALSTMIYGPLKLTYATAGLLFGGIAWALSGGDGEVLTAVVTPSVRGDYVLTPEHVRMERPIEFLGRDPQYREIQQADYSVPAEPSVSSGPRDLRADASFVQEDY